MRDRDLDALAGAVLCYATLLLIAICIIAHGLSTGRLTM